MELCIVWFVALGPLCTSLYTVCSFRVLSLCFFVLCSFSLWPIRKLVLCVFAMSLFVCSFRMSLCVRHNLVRAFGLCVFELVLIQQYIYIYIYIYIQTYIESNLIVGVCGRQHV